MIGRGRGRGRGAGREGGGAAGSRGPDTAGLRRSSGPRNRGLGAGRRLSPGPGALTAAASARLCCPCPGGRPADPLPPHRSSRRVSMMEAARLTPRALRHRWLQSIEHPAARIGYGCACAHSSSRPTAPLAAGRGGGLAPGPVGWSEGKAHSPREFATPPRRSQLLGPWVRGSWTRNQRSTRIL